MSKMSRRIVPVLFVVLLGVAASGLAAPSASAQVTTSKTVIAQ